jgi:hypothetical protein
VKIDESVRGFVRSVAQRFRLPYKRALEEEVARLRAENRGLVNSILGVAGIPPMRGAARIASTGRASCVPTLLSGSSDEAGADETNRPLQGHKTRPMRTAQADAYATEADGRAAAPTGAEATLRSVRRRSWQQIGRALELEDFRAAQRERESDAETFPAPRNVVPRA